MAQNRKWPTIDIYKLFLESDTGKWNAFLTACYQKGDLLTLQKTLYGIQAGMTDMDSNVKSQKITDFFIRIQRSIEITAKKIIRARTPSPLDNINQSKLASLENTKHHLQVKRLRDQQFEQFIRDISF